MILFCPGFFAQEDESTKFEAEVTDITDKEITMYCDADRTVITQTIRAFERDVQSGRISVL